MHGVGQEARTPKYAAIERERRFLVARSRPDLTNRPFVEIEDRYIDRTRLRLRRMRDGASGEIVFKLTRKYETDDVRARPIVTAYLTEAEHAVFAALPAQSLTKRRYRVPEAGGLFGIDLFEDVLAGLELAEIECPDAAALAALPLPGWLSSEVTDDPRFRGAALAALDATGANALQFVVTDSR